MYGGLIGAEKKRCNKIARRSSRVEEGEGHRILGMASRIRCQPGEGERIATKEEGEEVVCQTRLDYGSPR